MKYNESDFEDIYNATHERISKHVFFKVQNSQDAQDIVQELFFAFYKHMLKCTAKIENPQAYLIQMANNELSKYYKKKAESEITIEIGEDGLDLIESVPDDFELELDVLKKIAIEKIWFEIDKLSLLDKDLLIARFRFDMTYEEISKKYSMPESTIKGRIYMAIETIKKKCK
jgi:RNA polymerase sigma factor (sigma-70 family)